MFGWMDFASRQQLRAELEMARKTIDRLRRERDEAWTLAREQMRRDDFYVEFGLVRHQTRKHLTEYMLHLLASLSWSDDQRAALNLVIVRIHNRMDEGWTATRRSEHELSRSEQKRIAIQRGEAMPSFEKVEKK
jgi:hypothetical protein